MNTSAYRISHQLLVWLVIAVCLFVGLVFAWWFIFGISSITLLGQTMHFPETASLLGAAQGSSDRAAFVAAAASTIGSAATTAYAFLTLQVIRSMERQRLDSQRPVIVLGRLPGGSPDVSFATGLQNIGIGPALDISVSMLLSATNRTIEVETFSGLPSSSGSWQASVPVRAMFSSDTERKATVTLRATYHDTFGRTWSSTCGAEHDNSWVWPQGNSRIALIREH